MGQVEAIGTGGGVTPNTAPPIKELVSIQYLRGLAALGVVVWHAQGQVGLAETTVLQAGIEIFFVISGYVMWLILSARPVSPVTFLRKRLGRVVPLYWTLTTLVVLVLLIAPGLLQTTRFDLAHVVSSYLFVAWPNPDPGVGLKPLMIPGWTLNYEMAFYALLALALWLPRAWQAPFVIGVLGLLAACSVLPLPPIAHFYASPFMAELAMGVGLALVLPRLAAFEKFGPWILAAGLALLMVGGALYESHHHARLLLFALPAVLIVAGVVMWENAGGLPRLPGLKTLGDVSYPLYIVHPIVLSGLAQGWRALGLSGASPWIYVVVAVGVASIIGWAAHILLERPLVRLFQHRPRRAKTSPTAAVVSGQPLTDRP